jgi:hypothetical protein
VNIHRASLMWAAMSAVLASTVAAQSRVTLPAGLEPQTRQLIEQIADSLRTVGLPDMPLYEKAAEGKLKQASDAQIVAAVRGLARRFGEIHSSLGSSLDVASMSAAATALSAGVPLPAIKGLHDAAGSARDANADFVTALITLTDLVAQRVPSAPAASAVQSLLARRAPADQYARLRLDVTQDIVAGRAPDQAVRARTDAIIRSLPASQALPAPIKPPLAQPPVW